MQGWKCYPIQKAQLIIADVPYNVGNNFYGSNPMWYVGGDNKNGESKLAGKAAFASDYNFNLYEYFHFCSQLMRKEPQKGGERGRSSDAPCMIVFCAFEQMQYYIDLGRRYGFMHYIPLVFRKNFSAQVLKANMKIVGNCEYGLVLYKDKLPKFNNDGRMIFNCFEWVRDNVTPKVHPTQKPVPLLEELIRIFTDKDDVVIDPCAGSGTTWLAALQTMRRAYGFEIKKDFYKDAQEKVLRVYEPKLF